MVAETEMNPFSPFAQRIGLDIYPGQEVVDGNRIFTEVRGSDMWLVQEPYPMGNYPLSERYYVCNTSGETLSPVRWNAGDAIHDLLQMDPDLVPTQAAFPLSNYQ